MWSEEIERLRLKYTLCEKRLQPGKVKDETEELVKTTTKHLIFAILVVIGHIFEEHYDKIIATLSAIERAEDKENEEK